MSLFLVRLPFHVEDPCDRVGPRCVEASCSRVTGHPGPHRSVVGDTNKLWGNERDWGAR